MPKRILVILALLSITACATRPPEPALETNEENRLLLLVDATLLRDIPGIYDRFDVTENRAYRRHLREYLQQRLAEAGQTSLRVSEVSGLALAAHVKLRGGERDRSLQAQPYDVADDLKNRVSDYQSLLDLSDLILEIELRGREGEGIDSAMLFDTVGDVDQILLLRVIQRREFWLKGFLRSLLTLGRRDHRRGVDDEGVARGQFTLVRGVLVDVGSGDIRWRQFAFSRHGNRDGLNRLVARSVDELIDHQW